MPHPNTRYPNYKQTEVNRKKWNGMNGILNTCWSLKVSLSRFVVTCQNQFPFILQDRVLLIQIMDTMPLNVGTRSFCPCVGNWLSFVNDNTFPVQSHIYTFPWASVNIQTFTCWKYRQGNMASIWTSLASVFLALLSYLVLSTIHCLKREMLVLNSIFEEKKKRRKNIISEQFSSLQN